MDFDDLTTADQNCLTRRWEFLKLRGGYMHIKYTKPWEAAVALADSTAELAAWIVHEIHTDETP